MVWFFFSLAKGVWTVQFSDLHSIYPGSVSPTQHSLEDEQLIKACLNAGPPDGEMIIYDARSAVAATGNMLKVSITIPVMCDEVNIGV